MEVLVVVVVALDLSWWIASPSVSKSFCSLMGRRMIRPPPVVVVVAVVVVVIGK